MDKIKMQVDHETGDYWLMWMAKDQFSTHNITWAEFKESSSDTLYSNVPSEIIYSGGDINFDFLYDKKNNIFRQIQINRILPEDIYEVFNLTCDGFGSPWNSEWLGFHDSLENDLRGPVARKQDEPHRSTLADGASDFHDVDPASPDPAR